MNLGCSDGNCKFRRNTGQVTNGGCTCIRSQAIHTGDGWTIPVPAVQVMVAHAIQVAVEKQEDHAMEESLTLPLINTMTRYLSTLIFRDSSGTTCKEVREAMVREFGEAATVKFKEYLDKESTPN